MAIILPNKYPGRANPVSTEYPSGSFKNRTAPDAKDGTYLDQDWANDMSGFLQWLLANAGITANGQVDNALASQYAEALKFIINESGTPVGTIEMFAGSTLPENYLFADGNAVSRADYPKLFSAIGVTYGSGNGSTTFNLPDMRGEFPRGLDRGRGVDLGRQLGSKQNASSVLGTPINTSSGALASITPLDYDERTGLINGFGSNGTSQADSAGRYSMRPRNIALNFIIKAK